MTTGSGIAIAGIWITYGWLSVQADLPEGSGWFFLCGVVVLTFALK